MDGPGATDPRFKHALAELLAQPRYKDLTTKECTGRWFTKKRRALGARLWSELCRQIGGAGSSKAERGKGTRKGSHRRVVPRRERQ
jgi:hypothetical protein